MNSPVYKNRVKVELVDRARYLVRTRGVNFTQYSKKFQFYKTRPLLIRRSLSDGYIRIYVTAGRYILVIACSGKGYRFGREQARFDIILKALDHVRKDMVLDDLAVAPDEWSSC